MLPSALRGTSGGATMTTPGGAGTLPLSQFTVLGAPASIIESELPQPHRGGLQPRLLEEDIRYVRLNVVWVGTDGRCAELERDVQ